MAVTSLTYGIFARDNASPVFARVSKSISSAGREANGLSSGFSKMGSKIAFAAKGAGLALGAMAVAGAAAGLKTAASLQQSQIAFETLLGSAKEAKSFLVDLQKFAATTPFELPGVVDASRQLIGAGEAARDVIPTLTAWGDTAGALGLSQEQFSRVMLAVTQSMGKGKVQAEELMQMTEAGVPIWQLLSRALDKPIPKLQELSKEGRLLAAGVFPALERQMHKDYGGAMGKQAQTLSGLWSTFKDTLNLGLAQAIKPLIPILQNAMPGAMALMGAGLQKVAGFLAVVIPKVQTFLSSLGDSSEIQGLVGWFQGALLPAFEKAGRDVLPHLMGAFESIRGTIRDNHAVFVGLGQLITDVIIPILGKVAGIVLDVVGPAFKAIVWILQQIVIPAFSFFVAGVLGIFQGLLKGVAWVAKQLHLPFAETLQKTSDEFSNFVNETNDKLAQIITDVTLNVHVQPVVEPVVDASVHTPGFIGPTQAESLAARGIAGPYTPGQRGNLEAQKKAAAKAAQLGKSIGASVGGSLAGAIADSAPKVDKAGDKVKSAAQKKFDEIKAAAEQMRDSIREAVAGFFTLQSEGNPFRGLGAMAQKAVKFANAIGRLVQQGVPSGIISAIAQLPPDQGLRAASMLTHATKKDRRRVIGAFETIQSAADRAGSYAYRSGMGDKLSQQQLSELRKIRHAVTRHHKANPLNAGWSAA